MFRLLFKMSKGISVQSYKHDFFVMFLNLWRTQKTKGEYIPEQFLKKNEKNWQIILSTRNTLCLNCMRTLCVNFIDGLVFLQIRFKCAFIERRSSKLEPNLNFIP